MVIYSKTPRPWCRPVAKISFVILVAWGGALVPAGLAENHASDDLQVEVGRTVEITSSHRYCWCPSVHRFSTGEIMVDMMMVPDEINPEGDCSAYCISKDGGITWSRRYTNGAGAGTEGAFTEAPQKDGTHWLLYSYPEAYPEGQSQQFHDTLVKFSRGGMETHLVRDVVIRLAQPAYMAPADPSEMRIGGTRVREGKVEKQIRGMPWGRIIDGLNGGLLVPMYYITQRDREFYATERGLYASDVLEQHFRDVLLRSKDGGQSWDEYSIIAATEPGEKSWPWVGDEGPNEPAMVRLSDHRLYAVFRTGPHGYLGQTWSSDDGKTWTQPSSASFQGVDPRLHRLSNGMLALTTGRPGPIVIRFNIDGTGEKWSKPTEIFTVRSTGYTGVWSQPTDVFAGLSSCYTDFIEVEPGKLLVVYDSVPYGWHAIPYTDTNSKNAIYGTFVTVRKR